MATLKVFSCIVGLYLFLSAQAYGQNNLTDAPAQSNSPEIASVEKVEVTAQAAEERISLDLKGADINEIFKILSLKSGWTIINTPDVKGRVTVFLNNLKFEDALDVILAMQDLACEKTGNVVKIMTAAEYERLFGKKFDERKIVRTIKLNYAKPSNIATVITSLKSDVGKVLVDEASGTVVIIDTPDSLKTLEAAIKELDQPLETAVFDINYAVSADIKRYLGDLITQGVGQVIMDERSNKAVVSDLPQRLVKIKKLMTELDESSRQVMITGEIIQVRLNDKYQRGIDWETIFTDRKLDGLDLVGKFPLSSTEIATNYGKLNIGTLSNDNYTAVLNMLQQYGETSFLSRPQIVVVNKEEAKILVGAREAYITQSQSQSEGTTVTSESVQFIDVGVKLKVVPTIGKDGFITMRIKPEVSTVREVLTTKVGSQIPIVETSESESVVKVKDGAMIIIGGLIKKDNSNNTAGFPLLSKIPLVGALFNTKTKENDRTELVIFLSPKLLTGDSKITPEVIVDANKKI